MITILYGTDAWRLRHASQKIQATVRIDGTSPAASDELERLLKYPNFFGTRTVVVVTDPLSAVDVPGLLKRTHAKELADIDVHMVQRTTAKETADRKKVLAQFIRMATSSTEFSPLKAGALRSWIKEYCAEIGGTIETDAAQELVTRTGGDSWLIANELEKLCAYAQGGAVTLAAVRTLVPQPPQQDDWELSNALAAHDKRGALAALYRRIASGTPEPLLIGTIASALRSLIMVRELIDRGRPTAAIASATGLHPYVVSKTLRGSRLYDPRSLSAAHRRCALLDRAMKDGRTDGIDGLFGIIVAL